ncbi:putative protein SCAI [Helianthus annuus]|nr:putative protein SCAI [Helianthus annuus]
MCSLLFTLQILHGAERGEPAALLLSPLKPTFNGQSSGDITQNGSQFTLFLTAPLRACWQIFGLTFSDDEAVCGLCIKRHLTKLYPHGFSYMFGCFQDIMEDAESIVSAAFAEWEVILCTSTNLDLVWAQVLSEPLLRRIILR